MHFAANIIDQLPRYCTQVGAAIFSDRGQLLFRLNKYSNLDDARNAILITRSPSANTITGGIHDIAPTLFNIQNGDRPQVQNLALFISVSFDDPHIFVIADTDSGDVIKMRSLSSPRQFRNSIYFLASELHKLKNFIDRLHSSTLIAT